MVEDNVKKFLAQLPQTNPFGEKIRVVAAVKTQHVSAINEAIAAGIREIGDNHAQEFRDKYAQICGGPARHFIGRLQSNKIKYLLGRCDLYQSVDRLSIAAELDAKSGAAGVVSHALLQVNAGNEETKGGFSFEEIFAAYKEITGLKNIKIEGLMAMLPESDDVEFLRSLAKKTRNVFDILKNSDPDINILSMGMSGDWRLCVECGSNMIRIGTALFGARNKT